jgi:integrase
MYSYQSTIDKWLLKPWMGFELKDITKKMVYELVFEKINSTEHTKKYVLKIIKRIFQVALDLGYITHNPAQGLQVRVPESDKKVLTNAEAQIFLSEAKSTNHRFYPVWLMALFTGMRSGELYALRWTDIDLEAKTICVGRSWSSKNGFTTTKNQKSRVVPISEVLLDYLRELKLLSGQKEFVLPRLNEWERGEAAYVTREFCKSLGITEIKFHDLRATFITNLLSRGESLVRVMAIVGHADMETTNVYLRKAGIELNGGTERLGYSIPKEHEANVINVSFS